MAKRFGYYDDWESAVLECPKCGWKGTFDQGSVEYYAELMDCSCPRCDSFHVPMLAIVSYPTTKESRANWSKLSDEERRGVEERERFLANFAARKLRDPSQLPYIESPSFILHWDLVGAGPDCETLIMHGETIIFREPAVYEGYKRFIEVAKILQTRYGSALCDLVPTDSSETYLYGDKLSSPQIVAEARRKTFSVLPEMAGDCS
jgi:hypothetical protein